MRFSAAYGTSLGAAKDLWGSQSWLQPAFSRLSSPRYRSVSAARDAPERIVCRSCEHTYPLDETGRFLHNRGVSAATLRCHSDRPGMPFGFLSESASSLAGVPMMDTQTLMALVEGFDEPSD